MGDELSRGKRFPAPHLPSDGALAGGVRPETAVSSATSLGDPRLLDLMRNDIQCIIEILSDAMPPRRAASWLGTAMAPMPMDAALKLEEARNAKKRREAKEAAQRKRKAKWAGRPVRK